MSKKLTEKHRQERALVRSWGKQMKPFADAHPYAGSGSRDLDSLRVSPLERFSQVESHGDFNMRAYCGLPDFCEFAYSRLLAPFDEGNSSRERDPIAAEKNRAFASGLLSSLKNCYLAEGFDSFMGSHAYACIGSQSSALTFMKRNTVPEDFEAFLGLTRMTERFLDGHMKRFEQVRDRPHRYAVVPIQIHRYRGLTFKRLESSEDFDAAKFIFVSAKPAPYQDGRIMCALEKENSRREHAEQCNGVFMSKEDFLKDGSGVRMDTGDRGVGIFGENEGLVVGGGKCDDEAGVIS